MESTSVPPAGWGKDFAEGIATLAQELTEAKMVAEGRAAYVQSLFKTMPEKLTDVREKYDQAAGKYNGVCAYLEVMLSSNQSPKTAPKLDEARAAYGAFVDAARSLSSQSLHGVLFAFQALPIVDDVFKGIEVVLNGIEWFKARHEQEKLRIAEILKRTEWNSWANAGSAASESEPAQGAQYKTLKAQGGD
jgi:hypothetical protein